MLIFSYRYVFCAQKKQPDQDPYFFTLKILDKISTMWGRRGGGGVKQRPKVYKVSGLLIHYIIHVAPKRPH